MLLLSSSVFFIQDNEVSYNIYIDRETGRYFFKPTVYENRNICPPSFWVTRKGSSWEFDGITNKELKDQAIEELNYYLDFRVSEFSFEKSD
jgi:hypothetical protein